MKNITEYVSESMLITEFLGLGKTKYLKKLILQNNYVGELEVSHLFGMVH